MSEEADRAYEADSSKVKKKETTPSSGFELHMDPKERETFEAILQKLEISPERKVQILDRHFSEISGYIQQFKNIFQTQATEIRRIDSQIVELSAKLEASTKEASNSARSSREAFDQEIAAAKRTLHEHTRLTAPVDLWHEKREEHVNAQQKHQRSFQWSLFVIGVLALAILSVAVFSPNLIAQLLTPVGCDPVQPETCRGISSRSILGGATILTFFTVLLWFTRLQMKL